MIEYLALLLTQKLDFMFCCHASLYNFVNEANLVHNLFSYILSILSRSLVRSQLVSLEYFIDIKSFRSHYVPGVDRASNRNEYQGHFLGVKAAGG